MEESSGHDEVNKKIKINRGQLSTHNFTVQLNQIVMILNDLWGTFGH